MISRNMTINTPYGGIDEKPVALLIQTANRYDSRILIESGEKTVNAKSIMGMMTLVLSAGESIIVRAEGQDEADAIAGMEKCLSSNN